MKIFKSSKSFPASVKNPVVALGNFDGVHKAHQRMFALAKKVAKKSRGKTVVYTFDPHPVKILSAASAPLLINTLEQKLELLKKEGIDIVVLEPFGLKFAHMEAKEWFEKIIVKKLHAHGLVAGYDFTFGTHRSGTVELLHELSERYRIHCQILEAQLINETLISSTQIRQFVSHGEIKRAASLLGRPFFIEGRVIQGFGRGAMFGIPTANLKVENELLPQAGVYACFAKLGFRKYRAVANIGMNPTFGGKTLSVEAHLLNFKKNIYGKRLRLFFIDRIRDERSFSSPEKLVAQINKDITRGKIILSSEKPPK